MEENVALDSSKQNKFVKSIKGIKKLLKKKGADEVSISDPKVESTDEKPRKKKRKERGLVYLGHIPHGFYENEMYQYFSQFGAVSNVRVIRSPRTGHSKGYAFVEFKEPTVGEIVAETMNNYLMGKRLIKAMYIPPEKQKRAFRKRWNVNHNPTLIKRLKLKQEYNAPKDDEADIKKARKLLANIKKTKKKLSDMGINYDFFQPVDMPESLDIKKEPQKEGTPKIKKEQLKEEKVKGEKEKPKKKSKETLDNKSSDSKKLKQEKEKIKEAPAKPKKKEKTEQPDKENKIKMDVKEKPKKVKPEPVVSENTETKWKKETNKKLKKAGVQPLEDYIKVQESGSDSDLDFDSDEFEKLLAEEDDDDSDASDGDESGDDGSDQDDNIEGEESVGSEEESSVVIPKKKKEKVQLQQVQSKKSQKAEPKGPLQSQATKRKGPLKPAPLPQKKSKFEKQNNQKKSKQFKKKKIN